MRTAGGDAGGTTTCHLPSVHKEVVWRQRNGEKQREGASELGFDRGGTTQARRTTQDLWSPCQKRERERGRERNIQSEKVSLREESDVNNIGKGGKIRKA
jgi:hypothetical protein